MSAKGRKLTPMMQRYEEVKKENPGSLLLFRMGDFYELFNEDAQVASKVLGLTLTSRDKNSPNPVPMAGFPYHSLDGYLQKLIQAGHRAAICDQVEDPKKAKGLVKREVTQVITPGTLTDESLLDPRESNYLTSIHITKKGIGLSWLELSEGKFLTTETTHELLFDELARLKPAECLISDNAMTPEMEEELGWFRGMMVSKLPAWYFAEKECQEQLLSHFQIKTLEGFDLEPDSASVVSAGALLSYVNETQKSALGHISRLEVYRQGNNLVIDEATRRSLELTQTLRDGSREGSLLSVLDETVTSMGARLLADWLSNPLTDIEIIQSRQDAIEELSNDYLLCQSIREQLDQLYDMKRLTSRIATGRSSPRDLSCLTRSLALLPNLKAKLTARTSSKLQELETNLDLCPEIRSDIEICLADEPPLLITDGGIIRTGYNSELDEYRELAKGGKEWIAEYQAKESERIGIPNLKVGFNRVFGYYLEVTAANADKVPEEYIRKQTLQNQERYITPELKEYEEKVLQAEDKAIQLEQELFQALRDRVNESCHRIQKTAEVIAELDVLASLSILAVNGSYCRPEMTTEPILDLREARHPVLDRLQPSGKFVPNDARLGTTDGKIQIITGPNMAGKSTYIRQAALITIMGQMGSFVPASEARIGIADRIFARVGASDELGKGQSTFMVEMTETARILNTATKNSLVILDEIGRGTSTYDGVSLAWAITEYLHDVIECRTLFATHYHELTELCKTLKETTNWNVAVQELEGQIIFLHKIVEGAANKSYGIHVAQLAGVPHEVINRAKIILDTLEEDHVDDSGKTKVPERSTRSTGQKQLSLFAAEPHPVLKEIKQMDLNQMTPLAALEELHRIREELDN